jgi:minor extracellular serine protease Vpr
VVALTDTAGVALYNKIAAGPTTLTWTAERDHFVNPTGGRAAASSAYGLDAELQLKPNIGAPGALIRSTYPLEVQPYATLSGTSMSSPHVAGAVALYLEKHPDATPAQVRTALQNSADPVNLFQGTAFSPLVDAVHKQGAGMLDIDDAILAQTSITPSQISVGEGTTEKQFELTITNGGSASVEYSISHQAALSTGATFPNINLNTPAATFAASDSKVAVAAGGTATVTVTITPPSTNLRVYGGYIVISGDRTYRVPYAGLAGDYQAIQVLAAGGCAAVPFPAIFREGGETTCTAATPTVPAAKLDVAFTPQAAGATYNVEDRADRPWIFYHRAHQARRLEIHAIDQTTGDTYLLTTQDYLARNAANTASFVNGGFSRYRWDGKYVATKGNTVNRREAPAGSYQLRIAVTKATERGDTSVTTETWLSPTIHIVRAPVRTTAP